jgi:(S)-ureidoglycine---glyoxylate transaminase
MPVADLYWPRRLLAGGGPGSPDPRVLRSLTTPVIGQFDPAFTGLMDDVTHLARATFMTRNARCFAVTGLAAAGLEALLNTLLEADDSIAVSGGDQFVADVADMALRYGARVIRGDQYGPKTKLRVVPFVEPTLGTLFPVREIAAKCHAQGVALVVEATHGLGACELRVDDWGIDACVAGVDHALAAPSGMALTTYTADIEARMLGRKAPPRTSYLDLLQLQAYWSPERLNHHTAPTSLVYGLREALRLIHDEGLATSWSRHQRVGRALQAGLRGLGLQVSGDLPFVLVKPPAEFEEAPARRDLLENFGVYIRGIDARTWRVGLLGPDAKLDTLLRLLTAMESVLHATGAVDAAVSAYKAS